MATKTYDYGSLILALQHWVSENSDNLLDSVDTVIALAETRVESDLNLNIFDAVNETLTVSADQRVLNKPSDWMLTKSLYVRDPATQLFSIMFPRTEEFVSMAYAASVSGLPLFYCDISTTQILFTPPDDEQMTFRIKYKRRQEGLSYETSETWMSRNFSKLLFAACLLEASHILRLNDSMANRLAGDYAAALVSAKAELRTLMNDDVMEERRNG